MKLFEKHYDKIAAQRANFEAMLAAIDKIKDENERLTLAEQAAHYAAYRCTGYFTSSFLEAFFWRWQKA